MSKFYTTQISTKQSLTLVSARVKQTFNCSILESSGDLHWPQKLGSPERVEGARGRRKRPLLNNHTSLGRSGSAALGGSQSSRRTTQTHECQVCWTASTCKDLRSMDMSEHPETMTSHGSTAPVPPRKVLKPEARRTENLQLRGRHSCLRPLSHCGDTFSLKNELGTREPMSTKKHSVRAGRKRTYSDGEEARTTGTGWY